MSASVAVMDEYMLISSPSFGIWPSFQRVDLLQSPVPPSPSDRTRQDALYPARGINVQADNNTGIKSFCIQEYGFRVAMTLPFSELFDLCQYFTTHTARKSEN